MRAEPRAAGAIPYIRQILQEFDIRPDVSRMPLDSCHNYTSLNGWATRLVRQLDLKGWM